MEYLDLSRRIRFPDPRTANPWGIVAQGGNLSPGVLISAYEQGIFPWYEEDPILWFSPDPRFVLFLEEFSIPRRLLRTIRNSSRQVTFDRSFSTVIEECRRPRRNSGGTWITEEMVQGYRELHALGKAHSVEVWEEDRLVGGLYGVSVGRTFSGESMFSRERDAGKFALVALVGLLRSWEVTFIDCQSYTPHMAAFGAREVPREAYLELIESLVRVRPGIPGNWNRNDAMEALSNEIRCHR